MIAPLQRPAGQTDITAMTYSATPDTPTETWRVAAALSIALSFVSLALLPAIAGAAPVRLALGYEGTLESIACPSTSQCTAISDDGLEWTFNPTAPGTPEPVVIDPPPLERASGLPGSLEDAVVCPSTTQCTIVDSGGREVTFDPVVPGHPQPARIDNETMGSEERGSGDEGELAFGAQPLACPSATQCTTVDYEGNEVTFDPLAPGAPTPVAIAPHSHLRSLACPSTSQCVAADTGGREVTFDPLAPRPAAPVAIASHQLTSLACPTAGRCVTFDEDGQELTFDPLAPRPAVFANKGSIVAYGLACPSASQCTAAGGGGEYATFNPGVPGTLVPIGVSTITLTALACPSASQCTSVDMLGQEETFNPMSAAVSNASLSGVSTRSAKLSFAFTAGTSTAPLKTITVSLPRGLSFSGAQRNLASGVFATEGHRRLPFTARASGDRLAITLKVPAWRVKILLRAPAIAVAQTLAQDVSTARVGGLAIGLRAMSAGHATASATLHFDLTARRPLRLGIPPRVRAELLKIARRTAATNGERHPYDIEAVRTTHGLAERMVEEGNESEPPSKSAPVYVVAIRGHFRCDLCSRPPGARAPSGTVITLELLAPVPKRGSAFGLSSRYPNLKALGIPVHLERPRSHPHRP